MTSCHEVQTDRTYKRNLLSLVLRYTWVYNINCLYKGFYVFSHIRCVERWNFYRYYFELQVIIHDNASLPDL